MAIDFAKHVGAADGAVEEWSAGNQYIAGCAARDAEYRWWIEAHVAQKRPSCAA